MKKYFKLLSLFSLIFSHLYGCNKYGEEPNIIPLEEENDSVIVDSSIWNVYTGKHLNIKFKIIDKNAISMIDTYFNAEYDSICKLFNYYPSSGTEVKVFHTMNMMLGELRIIYNDNSINGYIVGIVTGTNSMYIVSPIGTDIFGKQLDSLDQLKVIPHEFIHSQIHHINYYTVTWLNEGTAYFLAKQGDIFKNSSKFHEVTNAIMANEIPSLSELEQDYNNFFRVNHSLTYSYLLVEFIASNYGIKSVIDLIKSKCDYNSTLGLTKEDFYKKWINYLKIKYCDTYKERIH